MIDTTDILDYVVHWRSKSESEFIGEVFFAVKNSSGGRLHTPVGYLIGFIEPASESSPSYWKILLTIREAIRYNVQSNTTEIFIKSVYANKLAYYGRKLKEFKRDIIRIDPKLPLAMQETLIQAGFCNSPLAIQMIVGKDKYVYSNVEFNFD
ncbi:hypothetical protein HDF18_18540 [Mucilaginibacter sp. X5P1]|uniref:hypothetical protein n=1 Tax=Mucilaginibacter sp. X5P1 TaxID=2723088 RepID=UPI0016182AA4|nr:hypothetical protein [Mucilaginibacter sp. X5P1]MBB6139643.1 hypothetical protein [Mucilaginibacter sp. X5P1]